MLLYEHQEGRGIGLMEKLRAYELQDQGFDTIDANLRLGHLVDSRDYALTVEILRFLNIRSLRFITNNPEKINAVIASGIEIVDRLSADVPGGTPIAQRILPSNESRNSATFPQLPSAQSSPQTTPSMAHCRRGNAAPTSARMPHDKNRKAKR